MLQSLLGHVADAHLTDCVITMPAQRAHATYLVEQRGAHYPFTIEGEPKATRVTTARPAESTPPDLAARARPEDFTPPCRMEGRTRRHLRVYHWLGQDAVLTLLNPQVARRRRGCDLRGQQAGRRQPLESRPWRREALPL